MKLDNLNCKLHNEYYISKMSDFATLNIRWPGSRIWLKFWYNVRVRLMDIYPRIPTEFYQNWRINVDERTHASTDGQTFW